MSKVPAQIKKTKTQMAKLALAFCMRERTLAASASNSKPTHFSLKNRFPPSVASSQSVVARVLTTRILQ